MPTPGQALEVLQELGYGFLEPVEYGARGVPQGRSSHGKGGAVTGTAQLATDE
jgi:hypothetical protein